MKSELAIWHSNILDREKGYLELKRSTSNVALFSNFTIGINSKSFTKMKDIDQDLKNDFEKGIRINSYFVMSLIEKLQEDLDLLEKESDSVYINLPHCHWEYKFSSEFKFKNIINSVINPKKRVLWDEEIEEFKTLDYFANDWSIIKTKYKKCDFADSAESVDKRMCFKAESEDENVVFIAYSSPIPESYNLSSTLYNFIITTFEAQEDGSTNMNCFVQFNSSLILQDEKSFFKAVKKRSADWKSNILNYLRSK